MATNDLLSYLEGVGNVAGGSFSTWTPQERSWVPWKMNIFRGDDKVCVPQCPGGHGQMVLKDKPPMWGRGKMWICSAMQRYNDHFDIDMLLIESKKKVKSKAIKIPKDVCYMSIDEAVVPVLLGLYKGKFGKLVTGQEWFEVPDPHKPCGCEQETVCLDEATKLLGPCCMLSIKRQRPPNIGHPQVVCFKSMTARRDKEWGSVSHKFCGFGLCRLMESAHNTGKLKTLQEAIAQSPDWAIQACKQFALIPAAKIAKAEEGMATVVETPKKGKKRAVEEVVEVEEEEEEAAADEVGSSSEEEEEEEDEPPPMPVKKVKKFIRR
jgi:hypothetical protein